MKKTLALILALVMLFSLTACGPGNQAGGAKPTSVITDEPVTITVWCWDPNFNIYAMNEAAKIYKDINPKVTIDVVETPWDDIQQKLNTSLAGNQTETLPDIILMQDNACEKNLLTYPNAFYETTGKVDHKDFAPYKVKVSTVGDKIYGVPFDNGCTATFVRRDYLEAAGFKPEDLTDITWDRFIEIGKAVKEKTGNAMISMIANSGDTIGVMMQSCGRWYFDKDGKTDIANNDVLKDVFKTFKKMVDSGIILETPDWNGYIGSLNNGSVASTIQGVWIIGSIVAEESQSGKWAVVNTPKLERSDSVNYSSNGGSGWLVLSSSKHPEIATHFLSETFGKSVPFYQTILEKSGAIATYLPASKGENYAKEQPFFAGQKIYEDIIDYAGKVPNIQYGIFNYEARDAVSTALTEYLAGGDLDTVLKNAQDTVDFLVGQ